MDDKFLIELDVLLDARLGTVALMSDALAESLLTDDYANRVTDELWLLNPTIDRDIYTRAYAERDLDTLYYSAPTDATLFLNQLINERIRTANKNDAQVQDVQIMINMYPYVIHEGTQQIWIDNITTSLRLDKAVTLGYFPPDVLSTEFIATNGWTVLVMYDIATWIKKAFSPNKQPRPIPRTIVIAPHLISSIAEVKKEMEITPPTKERVSPFHAIQMFMADIVGFKFLPTADFSLMGLTNRDDASTAKSEET